MVAENEQPTEAAEKDVSMGETAQPDAKFVGFDRGEDELGPTQPLLKLEVEGGDLSLPTTKMLKKGEIITVKVENSILDELGLPQPDSYDGSQCMRQNDVNAPNEVLLDGVATIEPHEVRDCKQCNHTAPGTEAETMEPIPTHEACNHTSPGTGGNMLIIPEIVEGCQPADIPSDLESECNHTSPGTGEGTSPTSSERSLGTRIEDFIKSQRSFSDSLDASSPRSMSSQDSLEELKQVHVDGENGLVLYAPDIVAKDERKEVEKPRKTVKLVRNQKLITEFFSNALIKTQTSSSAEYDALLAARTGSVSTNQKPASSKPNV